MPSAVGSAPRRVNFAEMLQYVHDSGFPLVVLRYPPQPKPADVAALYRAWDLSLARGPHAVLVDLSVLEPAYAGPRMRKVAADEVERRRAVLERQLVAEARAIPNPLLRTAAVAFDWIQGITFKRPLGNFASVAEAEHWLRAILAEKHLL
jgi:hypothetical protein